MNPETKVRARIAKALLIQRDPKALGWIKAKYVIAAIVLFAVHQYFSNIDSPLKLIPQTMSAIGMGYVLFYLMALRQFAFVSEFINWGKVEKEAEQAGA